MKKKNSKIWKIFLIAAVALVAFLLIGNKAGWIGGEKATEVEISTVEVDDLTQVVSASGKIQPEVEVKISPDVSGEIIALYVQEGDSVQKGQLLLKIQPENYISMVERFRAGVDQSRASAEQAKAMIASAESNLTRAQAEFNRQKQLFDDKVVSQADFQNAEANYISSQQDLASAKANYEAARFGIRSAEASLKDASENLRKTNIYAPMNGTVSKLAVELGERVVGTSQMAGTEMLRIANLNNMEVRVNVNENDIINVDLGDEVIVDVDAYSEQNRKFKGEVTRVANTALGSGGSLDAAASNSTTSVTEFEVRIKILPESYSELKKTRRYPFRPGMTATVDIVTQRKNGVLSLPISAVTTRSDDKLQAASTESQTGDGQSIHIDRPKEVVFIYEDGVAELKEVTTGITDISTGSIEITSGLKKGDKVVSGPYIEVSKNLQHGHKIVDRDADKNKKK